MIYKIPKVKIYRKALGEVGLTVENPQYGGDGQLCVAFLINSEKAVDVSNRFHAGT